MIIEPASWRHYIMFFFRHLRRRGRFAVFVFTLFSFLLTGLHLTFLTSFLEPHGREEASVISRRPPPTISEPAAAREILRTVEGKMKKGTGFADNLVHSGLSPDQVRDVVSNLAPHMDFRRLRAGDRFYLSFNPEGFLRKFTYQTGPLEELILRNAPDEWVVERAVIPSETRVETITGEIERSLFESLERLGEGDRLTMDFVDIFAWDIDFSHELHRGDTFRIVVEKKYREGDFITYGRILAAQYKDSEELHEATWFPYPDGKGDYYAPDGTSLRKTFLRAPVSYSRISSGYGRRRLHPVLKKVRAHLAVDYAAPAGTPVWAPADGVVISKSYDKRNGRKLVIRHPNGYRTYYLHLSRFAKGIKAGKKVRQKDVIGYVGSTGLATGPHLDYRMKRNGRWRNPLKEEFPPGEPLPKKHLSEFSRYRKWLAGRLTTPPDMFVSTDTEGRS